VFGISNTVLPDSYVDRGELDEELRRYLSRPEHIALRGASKCGKSWLRQMVLPDALIVQCRLKKTTLGYLQGCAEPARDTSRGREHKWDNLEGARRNAR
jgi:hypothetical protein